MSLPYKVQGIFLSISFVFPCHIIMICILPVWIACGWFFTQICRLNFSPLVNLSGTCLWTNLDIRPRDDWKWIAHFDLEFSSFLHWIMWSNWLTKLKCNTIGTPAAWYNYEQNIHIHLIGTVGDLYNGCHILERNITCKSTEHKQQIILWLILIWRKYSKSYLPN